MSRKRKILGSLSAVIFLTFYSAGYYFLPTRSSGRARGIETYVFDRQFLHGWEIYTFAPAGYVEASLIRFFPKPFLSNPAWAESGYPRMVALRSDDETVEIDFNASQSSLLPVSD